MLEIFKLSERFVCFTFSENSTTNWVCGLFWNAKLDHILCALVYTVHNHIAENCFTLGMSPKFGNYSKLSQNLCLIHRFSYGYQVPNTVKHQLETKTKIPSYLTFQYYAIHPILNQNLLINLWKFQTKLIIIANNIQLPVILWSAQNSFVFSSNIWRLFHCITKLENIFNKMKLICFGLVDGAWAVMGSKIKHGY